MYYRNKVELPDEVLEKLINVHIAKRASGPLLSSASSTGSEFSDTLNESKSSSGSFSSPSDSESDKFDENNFYNFHTIIEASRVTEQAIRQINGSESTKLTTYLLPTSNENANIFRLAAVIYIFRKRITGMYSSAMKAYRFIFSTAMSGNSARVLPLNLIFELFDILLDQNVFLKYKLGLDIMSVLEVAPFLAPTFTETQVWNKMASLVSNCKTTEQVTSVLLIVLKLMKTSPELVYKDSELIFQFLKHYELLDQSNQLTLCRLIQHSIPSIPEKNYDQVLRLRTHFKGSGPEFNEIKICIGNWGLVHGYEKYPKLFGKREFRKILGLFDKSYEPHEQLGMKMMLNVALIAPESAYNLFEMLDKLRQINCPCCLENKTPEYLSTLNDCSSLIIRSMIPDLAIPAECTRYVKPLGCVERSSTNTEATIPVQRRTQIFGINEFACVVFPILFRMITRSPERIQIESADTLFHLIFYIEESCGEAFPTIIKESKTIEFIAQTCLEPSVPAVALCILAECSMLIVQNKKLHKLIRKRNLAQSLSNCNLMKATNANEVQLLELRTLNDYLQVLGSRVKALAK